MSASLTTSKIIRGIQEKPERVPKTPEEHLSKLLWTYGPPEPDRVKHLLRQVQKEWRDENGNTWVHRMAFWHTKLLSLLVDELTLEEVEGLALQDNSYRQNALHVAAFSSHAEGFLQTLQMLFKVDSMKCLLGGRDWKNRTPLSIAVEKRHAGDVAALLEARADPAATVGEPIKDRMCRYFEQGKCRADSCQFAHCASELGAPRYAAKDSRTALTLAYVKHDGSTKSFDVIHVLVKAFGHARAKKQYEFMLHERG